MNSVIYVFVEFNMCMKRVCVCVGDLKACCPHSWTPWRRSGCIRRRAGSWRTSLSCCSRTPHWPPRRFASDPSSVLTSLRATLAPPELYCHPKHGSYTVKWNNDPAESKCDIHDRMDVTVLWNNLHSAKKFCNLRGETDKSSLTTYIFQHNTTQHNVTILT